MLLLVFLFDTLHILCSVRQPVLKVLGAEACAAALCMVAPEAVFERKRLVQYTHVPPAITQGASDRLQLLET